MDDEGRISRWSRLKRRNTAAAAKTAAADAPVPATADGAAESPARTEERAEISPEDLPDPDTLDKDSDFTVFLGDGVPEALRRKALSVLWRSDPILANLDGLNDYDEDYTLASGIGEAVTSAYRAGKGYLADDDASESSDEVGEDAAKPLESVEAESEEGNQVIDGRSAETGNNVSTERKNEPLE